MKSSKCLIMKTSSDKEMYGVQRKHNGLKIAVERREKNLYREMLHHHH
jgi:hypothetical protein